MLLVLYTYNISPAVAGIEMYKGKEIYKIIQDKQKKVSSKTISLFCPGIRTEIDDKFIKEVEKVLKEYEKNKAAQD